jgi:hypothetical protein
MLEVFGHATLFLIKAGVPYPVDYEEHAISRTSRTKTIIAVLVSRIVILKRKLNPAQPGHGSRRSFALGPA